MEAITFETILSAIDSVGFPIVLVIGLVFFCYWMIKQNNERTKEREAKLYEIIHEEMDKLDKFSLTMDKFNETLIKIDSRVEIIENKLK